MPIIEIAIQVAAELSGATAEMSRTTWEEVWAHRNEMSGIVSAHQVLIGADPFTPSFVLNIVDHAADGVLRISQDVKDAVYFDRDVLEVPIRR